MLSSPRLLVRCPGLFFCDQLFHVCLVFMFALCKHSMQTAPGYSYIQNGDGLFTAAHTVESCQGYTQYFVYYHSEWMQVIEV